MWDDGGGGEGVGKGERREERGEGVSTSLKIDVALLRKCKANLERPVLEKVPVEFLSSECINYWIMAQSFILIVAFFILVIYVAQQWFKINKLFFSYFSSHGLKMFSKISKKDLGLIFGSFLKSALAIVLFIVIALLVFWLIPAG